jgi:hypothetical protein
LFRRIYAPRKHASESFLPKEWPTKAHCLWFFLGFVINRRRVPVRRTGRCNGGAALSPVGEHPTKYGHRYSETSPIRKHCPKQRVRPRLHPPRACPACLSTCHVFVKPRFARGLAKVETLRTHPACTGGYRHLFPEEQRIRVFGGSLYFHK